MKTSNKTAVIQINEWFYVVKTCGHCPRCSRS